VVPRRISPWATAYFCSPRRNKRILTETFPFPGYTPLCIIRRHETDTNGKRQRPSRPAPRAPQSRRPPPQRGAAKSANKTAAKRRANTRLAYDVSGVILVALGLIPALGDAPLARPAGSRRR